MFHMQNVFANLNTETYSLHLSKRYPFKNQGYILTETNTFLTEIGGLVQREESMCEDRCKVMTSVEEDTLLSTTTQLMRSHPSLHNLSSCSEKPLHFFCNHFHTINFITKKNSVWKFLQFFSFGEVDDLAFDQAGVGNSRRAENGRENNLPVRCPPIEPVPVR